MYIGIGDTTPYDNWYVIYSVPYYEPAISTPALSYTYTDSIISTFVLPKSIISLVSPDTPNIESLYYYN